MARLALSRFRTGVLGLLILTFVLAPAGMRPAAAASAKPVPEIGILDLIEMELGHTSIAEQYERPVPLQGLLDGARTGLIAYLRTRGIANPAIARMHARADGRGAVPAIEQQIAGAVVRYGDRVVPRELVYAALRGELASLHDPYSVLFTAAELKKFSAFVDGTSFAGIGIVLAYDDATKTWRADQVFDGGPAARAGIQPNDTIATVDGTPVSGLSNERITALLRGKAGSIAHAGIVRDGVPLAQPIAIVRATITPPEVTSRRLAPDVGYVALHGFPLDAAKQVRTAMQRLAAGGAHAFVFDLRGNGGGYEGAAAAVASVFIASGPVVSIEERRGKRRTTNAAGNALPATPLAVLVDGDSASGAELVAAAVQDRHRGRLFGVKTFGKGVVQTMLPLPDGAAIKLTTARYFTPAGRFIDHIGIVPDEVVTEPAGSDAGAAGHDPQLDAALAWLAAAPR